MRIKIFLNPLLIILEILLFGFFSVLHHYFTFPYYLHPASWVLLLREILRLGLLAVAVFLVLSLVVSLRLFGRRLRARPSARNLGAFFLTWVSWW